MATLKRKWTGSTLSLTSGFTTNSNISFNTSTATAALTAGLSAGATQSMYVSETNTDGSVYGYQVVFKGVSSSGVVTVSALSLSSSTAVRNTNSTITISGATTGSTLIGVVPAGMTLNSSARTITGTPTKTGVFYIRIYEVSGSSMLLNEFAFAVTSESSAVPNAPTLAGTAGSGIEAGMSLFNGTTFLYSRIYKQLTGTAGGIGTYQLDAIPNGGDIASTTLLINAEGYASTYPVHPSPAGHLWCGQKLAEGTTACINALLGL